jgi:coproporphyrinogen III oxidase-like Fe-S oxidoreductase
MSDIASKGRLLTRRGLDVLVIDTMSALPGRKLPKFTADLKRLWHSGVEILLCIEDQTIFFDDMKDLVTTSEFIDTYEIDVDF